MTTIKIPGTIEDYDNDIVHEINENSEDNNSDELKEYDVLDNQDNTEIDFNDDIEPNEHADINIDDIAGNENGYDPPAIRLEQEIKLAEHDEKNNKMEESVRHRIRVTALSSIIYPPFHWKIGKYKTELAHSYIDLFGSRFAAQCEDHATEALKIMSQSSIEIFNDHECVDYLKALISSFYALARAELVLKKTEDSEKNINKALMNLNKLDRLSILSEEEIFPINLKLNLAAGKISFLLQKLSAASQYYNTACEMIKTNKVDDSADLIPIYQFLGKIEQSNGNLSNHSKAIEHYLMAHALANKHYECHSDQVIQSARALATAYSIIGTIDSEKSAEMYLKECIYSLVLKNGESHPLVFEIETDLARLFIRSNRKTEALTKLKSNYKKEKMVFGEYSDQTLVTNKLIGSLELSSGNMSEALKYYQQALLIDELKNGPSSKSVKELKRLIEKIKITTSPPMSNTNLKNRPLFKAVHKPK